jgi:hypothetical protein
MQIALASVLVEDQERALAFYTLGFEKKHDIPMGEFRWLTVCSPGGRAGPRTDGVPSITHIPEGAF